MAMIIKKDVLKVITAVILAASFLIAGSPANGRFQGTAEAQPRTGDKKISSDAEETVGYYNRIVNVIIDTAPSTRSAAYRRLMDRIEEMGGTILRSLNEGKTASVMISAQALPELAEDNAVKFISLDRDTQVTGHLETTTGAALVRSYGTYNTGTIDGHGIGIAILDSG